MKATKIDWCDCTINPVIGCKNGCPYCYAERLNKRFGFIPDWNDPQFFPERLKQLNSKTPKTIFMDSMSDVGHWNKDWGETIRKAILSNPQHAYIFLTKNLIFGSVIQPIRLEPNIFCGRSVTKQSDLWHIGGEGYDFLSIEPLLEKIDIPDFQSRPAMRSLKQIIIGAETGNRKGKVVPKKEWVLSLVKYCNQRHIRVFMKESLREIMGDDFRQDELIWQTYVKSVK